MPAAFQATYTATPLAAGTKLIFEATPMLSPGVTFIRRSLYKQILVTAAAAASPADLLASWNARYGAIVTGKKIGVRATVITSDGQRSAPLTYTLTTT